MSLVLQKIFNPRKWWQMSLMAIALTIGQSALCTKALADYADPALYDQLTRQPNAQVRRWPYPTPYPGQQYQYPGTTRYYNPYANPYANPYVNPYVTPGAYVPAGPGVRYYQGPAFAQPNPIGLGYFSTTVGGSQYVLWKAPSGYYYPWCNQQTVFVPYFNYVQPLYYNQGAYTPQKPPLDTIFSDMNKYLDESKEKGKVGQLEYEHLKRRLSDIMNKTDRMKNNSGGILSEEEESEIRRDIETLSREVAYRVHS